MSRLSYDELRQRTFERVLTADVDRKIETSVSCVGTSSGAKMESPFCRLSRCHSHCWIRLSRSFNRAGEYDCLPRSRVWRMSAKVFVMEERSLEL